MYKKLKCLLPHVILKNIRKIKQHIIYNKYKKLSNRDIFSQIYEKGIWGISSDPLQPFFSGSGSRQDYIISPYINAVREFLFQFKTKPTILDIGCGDFYVGSKIREYCADYIACDIVPSLIEYNQKKFASLNVIFKVLDCVEDDLPVADIVIIRQVFQHLSNKQICKILKNFYKYNFAIVTEHVPGLISYEYNLDKIPGPNTRLEFNSGVVLTKPPFNLRPYFEKQLCEIKENESIIVTTLYQINNNINTYNPN